MNWSSRQSLRSRGFRLGLGAREARRSAPLPLRYSGWPAKLGRMKTILASVLSISLLLGCSSKVAAPSNIQNSNFPSVVGTSLKGEVINIPESYAGKTTLLLIGYLQKTQFDIDRWILGALQADVKAEIVEVPTIAGMVPQMVQGFIDGGMRSGIPQSDWGSVVTVYKDADKIIQALGNERPQSAYAVLLDKEGRIVWSSNIGYSAAQVLELKRVAAALR